MNWQTAERQEQAYAEKSRFAWNIWCIDGGKLCLRRDFASLFFR